MIDLDTEYASAWARTPRAILDKYEAARHFGLLGVARVMIERGLYQPTPEGEPALIIAVRGNPDGDPETDEPMNLVTGGPLLDLIAVPLTRPTTWALRRCVVTFAGACEYQAIDPPPVRVHRTPLGWLRAGCDGVALLTDDWREQRDVLLRFRKIVAEDGRHGETLARLKARREFEPEIFVPRATRDRRAA